MNLAYLYDKIPFIGLTPGFKDFDKDVSGSQHEVSV